MGRQFWRAPKYSEPNLAQVSCSCNSPEAGAIGDWHIQLVQEDRVTQYIVFHHNESETAGWVTMFTIPVTNPMPQTPQPMSLPQQRVNYDQAFIQDVSNYR